MLFLKRRIGRISGPVLICTALVAVLGVTAAVAVPKFVTGKKVVTTITKKSRATELRVTGPRTPGGTFDPNASSSLMATLPVPKGPWVVTSTFTERKDTGGLVLSCKLRLGSAGEDSSSFFGGGGQIQVPAAMSVAGTVKGNSNAELRCYDGSLAVDSQLTDIELTATKLPKINRKSIP
jgi:hypothetical protein